MSSLYCQSNKLTTLDISNDYYIRGYIDDNGAYFKFYYNDDLVSSYIHNLKDIISTTIYSPENTIHNKSTKKIVEEYMSNRT